MAAASFDPLKRWFGSCSVCTLLSTIFGVCHSAEVGNAALAAVAAVVAAVAAAAAPDVDEVVAKYRPMFFMASPKTSDWQVPVATEALFHLEVDVVASWNNVATCTVHEPHLAR